MEIRIKKSSESPKIMVKITYVLIGILASASLLSIGIKTMGTYGVGISFLICITLIYFGFVKTKSESKIRLCVWGMLGTIAFSVLMLFIFHYTLSKI